MVPSKILIVEDEPAIHHLIHTALDPRDYQYHTVQNESEALMEIVSYPPNIIIMNLGLPNINGVYILKKIRSFSNVPIIVVSTRMKDQDKVNALDAGADDYLTETFSIDKFPARFRAAIRRSHIEVRTGENDSIYKNGDLTIDFAAGCTSLHDKEIHLAPIEYRLLCLLAKNTGTVLTHNRILKEMWGVSQSSGIPSLWVFMATLRKKWNESHHLLAIYSPMLESDTA